MTDDVWPPGPAHERCNCLTCVRAIARQRLAVREALKELVAEGKIIRMPDGRYVLPRHLDEPPYDQWEVIRLPDSPYLVIGKKETS